MRSRRASHGAARPLNCGVMRHLVSATERCARTFLLTSLLAFSVWSSDVLACNPERAAKAMETEDFPRVYEHLADCNRSGLSGLSLGQLGWAIANLADLNDSRAWSEAWRRAADLFVLGARKGNEDSILFSSSLTCGRRESRIWVSRPNLARRHASTRLRNEIDYAA